MTVHTRLAKKVKRHIDKDYNRSGSYGIYIQLSNTKGIKLLRCDCNSREELIKNGYVKKAVKEAYLLKRVRKVYSQVPKCYGVRILKIGNKYKVGIILQHLGNKRLADIHDRNTSNVSSRLEAQLAKVGVYHGDIHVYNIMYYRDKYWVIDFGNYIDIAN